MCTKTNFKSGEVNIMFMHVVFLLGATQSARSKFLWNLKILTLMLKVYLYHQVL